MPASMVDCAYQGADAPRWPRSSFLHTEFAIGMLTSGWRRFGRGDWRSRSSGWGVDFVLPALHNLAAGGDQNRVRDRAFPFGIDDIRELISIFKFSNVVG